MHRLVFGLSFAELVVPILLLGLTLYFLYKKKAGVCGNAEDVDTGASGSLTVPTETNSVASSSSPTEIDNSAPSSSTHYEVFLSFRGPDTRHGFTDHLYDRLLNAGIYAFRDDDELSQGENIRPKLVEAITNSKILIPILSETYGTSSWCLDELVQIMERKDFNGQIVLPIFYKVKPADVRHQIGSFGDKFHEHERRLRGRPFNPTILEKRKKALNEVSALKGYEANGSEVELVKSIVRNVLSELMKKFKLVITENLVGIDTHVKKVMEFVDNNSRATLFVGIHGMGGIGKTTLAKAIYNKLANQFEDRSFIADIRELWKRNDKHYLQNRLIYDILKVENGVCNEDQGINFISSRFKCKRVLILLDDVDDVVQLKYLAGNRDWFSSGSRIVITTRDMRILEAAGVDHNYDLRELDHDQSLKLFSKHAFRRDFPPSKFEGLTHDVVSTTGGLPLSLEVLGSLLGGRESNEWGDIIRKLKKVPRTEVQQKLRISYDALDDGQKQIFLDIACFLIGVDRRIAFYMWDACGFFPGEDIEVLRFMSLIKIGDDHEFRMHDQLRDLGRTIVYEENRQHPWHRSRLWDCKEAWEVLKGNKGTKKIEAINLSEDSLKSFDKTAKRHGNNYTSKQFKKLTSLRLLFMKGAHLSGDFEDSMEELKWLQWQNCPASFEGNNFHVDELVVLELQRSEINEKWRGWSFFKMAEKLKYLDLTCCFSLEETDFLSAFKKLEVLILSCCRRLKRVSASIGDMEALLRLELAYCRKLNKLPAEIGNLKALKQLNLCDAQCLTTLPDSIWFLENLEILDISATAIRKLPNDIVRLRKLRELCAPYCRLERIMAESMSGLSSLRRLIFINCYTLQSLPELPSSLTVLGITCESRKLPSLSHLTHLKELQVCFCRVLECIQVLSSTPLKNSECSQLTEVEGLESPQSLNMPFKLEILDVNHCQSIKIVDVSHFVHLRTLLVKDCKNLLEVRGLDKLTYLESLDVEHCDSIERLDLPKFGRLKELYATNCENLAKIEGLDGSEYLERLDILGCTSIGRLLLPKFGRLKKLMARGCKNLAGIEGLDGSEYLEWLDIEGCTSIGRLLLPKSGRLKELQTRGCKNLVEIQGLDRLVSRPEPRAHNICFPQPIENDVP